MTIEWTKRYRNTIGGRLKRPVLGRLLLRVRRDPWGTVLLCAVLLLTGDLARVSGGDFRALPLILAALCAGTAAVFSPSRGAAYLSSAVFTLTYGAVLFVSRPDFLSTDGAFYNIPLVLAFLLPNPFASFGASAYFSLVLLGYRGQVPHELLMDSIRGNVVATAVSAVFAWSARSVARERAKYRKLSRTDSLTGLATLEHAMEFGQELLDAGCAVRVCVIDLDHFKQINDTYGHLQGNRMLIAIGKGLSEELAGSRAVVGRLGGDEFILIGEEDGGDSWVKRVPQQLLRVADELEPALGLRISGLSLSAGEATSRDLQDPGRIEDVIKAADHDMYRRKYSRRSFGLGSWEDNLRGLGDRGLQLLSVLAERDLYTYLHAGRVSEFASWFAGELGFAEGIVESLRVAGWLHDVGKILIPRDILRKPDRLTAEEYAIVHRHVADGLHMVEDLPLAAGVRQAILHHHERWDGAGYPRGVRGEDIPLEARILQLADAFLALTTRRLYQEPRGWEDALEELAANGGSQFDPFLTVSFVGAASERIRSSPGGVLLIGASGGR